MDSQNSPITKSSCDGATWGPTLIPCVVYVDNPWCLTASCSILGIHGELHLPQTNTRPPLVVGGAGRDDPVPKSSQAGWALSGSDARGQHSAGGWRSWFTSTPAVAARGGYMSSCHCVPAVTPQQPHVPAFTCMLVLVTVQELRIACTVAQQEREGGVAARVSPLAQVSVCCTLEHIKLAMWMLG
jgi:hypothetical protein